MTSKDEYMTATEVSNFVKNELNQLGPIFKRIGNITESLHTRLFAIEKAFAEAVQEKTEDAA